MSRQGKNANVCFFVATSGGIGQRFLVSSARKQPRPSNERILGAAAKEFARRGYGGTSLRQLMAAARVSTTAFYARYATKEAVLGALVLNLLQELETHARTRLVDAGGLADGFERSVDVLLEVIVPKKHVVRIALSEGGSSSMVSETLRNLYAALAGLLASNIRSLARRGLADDTDADTVAWNLVGALNMQVIRWAVFGDLTNEQLGPALRDVARTLLPLVDPAAAVGSDARGKR
jgi:AcrR family transcriptional regulator